jgi:hypothetical protein
MDAAGTGAEYIQHIISDPRYLFCSTYVEDSPLLKPPTGHRNHSGSRNSLSPLGSSELLVAFRSEHRKKRPHPVTASDCFQVFGG